ncbi:MAG TPA: hypothetical protein ENJ09_02090, partial [Planctomycetes bacterium]|nr:hypothetical protein [Planctomycetota bacterium]
MGPAPCVLPTAFHAVSLPVRSGSSPHASRPRNSPPRGRESSARSRPWRGDATPYRDLGASLRLTWMQDVLRLATVLTLLAASSSGQKWSERVSTGLVVPDLRSASLSPGGLSAVSVVADLVGNEHVWVTPRIGSPPWKVVGPNLPTTNRWNKFFSPFFTNDNKWVLYQPIANGRYYRVLAAQPNTPELVGGDLVPGGKIYWLEQSLDGRRVLYVAEQDTFKTRELYSAPVDGSSPPVKLHPPAAPGGLVYTPLALSPDGLRVVFRGFDLGSANTELYSSPIDGSSPAVVLNAAPGGGSSVSFFELSPDGKLCVYSAFQNTSGSPDLFVVPSDGSGSPTQLNDPLPAGKSIRLIQWSPDGKTISYHVLGPRYPITAGDFYAVPADRSSPPVEISDRATYPDKHVSGSEFTPDSQAIFFSLENSTFTEEALFSRPVRGGPLRRLSAKPFARARLPEVSPDGRWAVWEETEEFSTTPLTGVTTLEVAPANGSYQSVSALKSVAWNSKAPVFFSAISGDSSRVSYIAKNAIGELVSVPISGGPPIHLGGAAPRKVSGLLLSPDGSTIYYSETDSSGADSRLFMIPVDGSEPRQQLTQTVPPLSPGVVSWWFENDGRVLVYRFVTRLNESLWVRYLEVEPASLRPVRGSLGGGTAVTIRGESF